MDKYQTVSSFLDLVYKFHLTMDRATTGTKYVDAIPELKPLVEAAAQAGAAGQAPRSAIGVAMGSAYNPVTFDGEEQVLAAQLGFNHGHDVDVAAGYAFRGDLSTSDFSLY